MRNSAYKVLIFCVMAFSLLSLCSCKTIEIDVHIPMFSGIEECRNIETIQVEGAKVEIYDPHAEDEYLKNLEYQDAFACKYTSEEFTFEIFAYEFLSNDDASAYFKNVTGKSDNPNPTFSNSSGMSSHRRVAVSENKAYTVYCPKVQKEQVVEFLKNWFSVDLADSFQSVNQGPSGDTSAV